MSELQRTGANEAERRVAPRVRTLKRARVLFNNRFSTIDCIARNVSATGALLTIDPAVHIPKTFEITIGEGGQIRPAKLVYRREMFAGVHFLDAPAEETAHLGTVEGQAGAGASAEPATDETSVHRIIAAPLPRALAARLPWAVFG
ncbi:PilZ domain-containing protein [Aureimonas populi]|uniref:PilZ domain-containing protein n=1 Tax=Aureimonas populi TaxID=1701758 RepID=A0ABW5CKL7_9HYPH|nr:PilZ domain-containing protein [Aureimonas populi]